MILKYLRAVKDPRRGQGKRYGLEYILLFSLLAMLCGAKSYRDIHRFLKEKRKNLNALFGLQWKGVPAHSRIRNIMVSLDGKSLEQAFRHYSRSLAKEDKKQTAIQLAIDGKSLRHSFDHESENKALHLLSGFCSRRLLILGHLEVAAKTNEIPAAQQLIEELGLPEGSVYTLDAMHCQKKPLPRSSKAKAV